MITTNPTCLEGALELEGHLYVSAVFFAASYKQIFPVVPLFPGSAFITRPSLLTCISTTTLPSSSQSGNTLDLVGLPRPFNPYPTPPPPDPGSPK